MRGKTCRAGKTAGRDFAAGARGTGLRLRWPHFPPMESVCYWRTIAGGCSCTMLRRSPRSVRGRTLLYRMWPDRLSTTRILSACARRPGQRQVDPLGCVAGVEAGANDWRPRRCRNARGSRPQLGLFPRRDAAGHRKWRPFAQRPDRHLESCRRIARPKNRSTPQRHRIRSGVFSGRRIPGQCVGGPDDEGIPHGNWRAYSHVRGAHGSCDRCELAGQRQTARNVWRG